ncbi:MAG: fibronectin type III-like domain-contianing protein, partial [Thermofilaceae archaeon]
KYSDLRIKPEVIENGNTVEVSVTVENIGEIKGDEVVQLYITKKRSSVTRPVRELRGFKRITIEPGKRVQVTFKLPIELLAFYDRNARLVVEPGEYRVIVARHAEDTVLEGQLKVVGKTLEVASRRLFLTQADVILEE